MVAFFVTCRLTLLLRWIAPVENSPAGTTTRPPPARLHASTLRRNPTVQSNLPSPRAPNFVISKSRFAKVGALMRARIRGNKLSHGPSYNIAGGLCVFHSHIDNAHAADDRSRRSHRTCFSLLLRGLIEVEQIERNGHADIPHRDVAIDDVFN